MPNLPYGWLQRLTARTVSLESGVPVYAQATGRTLTAAEAYRNVHVANVGAAGAIVFALPAAKRGMRVTALVKAAQALRLDPNGTETVSLPSSGVQQAAGKYIEADAVGESVVLVCTVDGTWDAIGPIDGTWTVEA